jgi:hypothetical protein
MQGQELDEKTQPILWKKSQLVHLFVGAGSLWPLTGTIGNIPLELWLPPEFLSFVKSWNYNN